MRNRLRTAGIVVAGLGFLAAMGCGGTQTSTPAQAQAEIDAMDAEVNVVKGRFKNTHPDAAAYYDGCAGYAVFPKVRKGAFIIGGGYGKGLLYNNGSPDVILGRCSITQGSIGLSIGGQSFSEIIFFQDEAALDRFMEGKMEVNAVASAVAAAEGVTGQADYSDGVAVFVMGEKGLMAEASIGGQKFKFTPM